MQRVKWITLLVVLCVCVSAISAYAQLPSANWPKYGRDYHNSSHNPNVSAIAKPVPVQVQYYNTTATPARWTTGCYVNHDGIKTDPLGNIYLFGDYTWSYAVYNSSLEWQQYMTMAQMGAKDSTGFIAGITIYGNNSSFSQLTTLGQNLNDSPNWLSVLGVVRNFTYDGTNINTLWTTNTAVGAAGYICTYPGYATTMKPYSCDSAIAVAPDGSVYWGNTRCSQADPQGPIVAWDSTGNEKWHYTGANLGLGRLFGSYAIGYQGTSNIVYATGQQCYEHACQDGLPSVIAIDDTPDTNGNQYTFLWKHSANEGGLGNSSLFLRITYTCQLQSAFGPVLSSGYTPQSAPYPAVSRWRKDSSTLS